MKLVLLLIAIFTSQATTAQEKINHVSFFTAFSISPKVEDARPTLRNGMFLHGMSWKGQYHAIGLSTGFQTLKAKVAAKQRIVSRIPIILTNQFFFKPNKYSHQFGIITRFGLTHQFIRSFQSGTGATIAGGLFLNRIYAVLAEDFITIHDHKNIRQASVHLGMRFTY